MTVNSARLQKHLRSAEFRELFVDELGWDHHAAEPIRVAVDGTVHVLTVVAEKRGFVVYQCSPASDGRIPGYATRQKVERQALKAAFEHVIIFCDEAKTTQIWQWVRREGGQRPATREQRFRAGDKETALLEQLEGLAFELAEEEDLSIPAVAARVQRAFDVENVTKKFYERFREEHVAFLGFIEGIRGHGDRAWYASVMLNRMMFVYFIQKKGFLDSDKDYLRNRLKKMQQGAARGTFARFYRLFLLKLFHEGLGQPVKERKPELEQLLGKVPYLNGGLFDVHELERENDRIEIPDAAFERIFSFFDSYKWHVDDRPLRTDKEINPDVLGYIFQKYITDQAKNGAYYTKEDVTEYMAANVIVPLLLVRVEREFPTLFVSGGVAWRMIAASPQRYIPRGIKFGVDAELPSEIASASATSGILDAPAGEKFSACNETWRELLQRREQCARLQKRLASAELSSVDDLVTLNVDVALVAQDFVKAVEDPKVVRTFWREIRELSVLDPTCGSGAFLFAALNVLAPLYGACLEAITAFIEERTAGALHTEFEGVLEELRSHPSRSYFVMKSILIGNLYGVDIMAEAVEICKLRLFLKLVAQVSAVEQVEPLPDIDFNVRSGNALIGFASLDELRGSVEATLKLNFSKGTIERIEKLAQEADAAFQVFRGLQTEHGADRKDVAAAKGVLRQQLAVLREELDAHLASESGVNVEQKRKLDAWNEAHAPFHWFVEFYGIIRSGGFDVIIGNPPYVPVPEGLSRGILTKAFRSALVQWSSREDLYTFVMERSLALLDPHDGRLAMIVPLSLAFSTQKPFIGLRQVMMKEKGNWWWSHFDRIPSALFGQDVRTRCTIALLARSRTATSWAGHTTSLRRWETEKRELLLASLVYAPLTVDITEGIPKVATALQAQALEAMLAKKAPLAVDLRKSIPFSKLKDVAPDFPKQCVFVGGTAYNWFPAWRDIPTTTDERGRPSLPARTLGFRFPDEESANVVFALLCSSLGYWWWAVAADGFNLKKWLLQRFPLSTVGISAAGKKDIGTAGAALRKALKGQYRYKDNKGRIGNFFLPGCVDEVAAIDEALARHVPALSRQFFEDVRAFNRSFSRAEADDESDEEDDEDE